MSTVSFRNRNGKLVDVPVVSASRFKNEFGTAFEQAALNGAVVITKRDTPKAVLLSYAEFEALTGPRPNLACWMASNDLRRIDPI